jgi:hypothetical protein
MASELEKALKAATGVAEGDDDATSELTRGLERAISGEHSLGELRDAGTARNDVDDQRGTARNDEDDPPDEGTARNEEDDPFETEDTSDTLAMAMEAAWDEDEDEQGFVVAKTIHGVGPGDTTPIPAPRVRKADEQD